MCQKHYARDRRHGNPSVVTRAVPGDLLSWLQRHVSYESDDCIRWPYAYRPDGYPAGTKYNGKRMCGHRVMCFLAHGAPPTTDHEAAHSCGNGSGGCLNPRHLRWATPLENQQDKSMHGTTMRGSTHYAAKLTTSDIKIIRSDRREQWVIAQERGISQSTVSLIKTRKRWQHVV